jgi:hypothetical protein
MTEGKQNPDFLPEIVQDYIATVVKIIRYRRRVRNDVQQELIGHFTDALTDCENKTERKELAKNLIEKFGDAQQLAKLIRQGKKRCRPLWKKVVIRTGQVFGCLVLFVVLRGAYIGLGEPTVRVNYLQWLTDQSRQNRDESQNAFGDIAKTLEHFVEPATDMADAIFDMWPDEMNDEEFAIAHDYLDQNKTALDLFRQATQKPHYWVDYTVGMDQWQEEHQHFGNMSMAIEKIITDTRNYRLLAKTVKLSSMMAYHQGDKEQALSDCVALQKFGQFLNGNGLLAEQLIGMAIESLAHHHTLAMLSLFDFDVQTLRSFQSQLNSSATASFPFSHDETQMVLYDTIQRGFTDDGHGGGRVLPPGLFLAVNDWTDMVSGIFLMNFFNRRDALAMVENYLAQSQLLLDQTPYQRQSRADMLNDKERPAQKSFFLKTLIPSYDSASQQAWRLISLRQVIRTVVAIQLYQKEKGTLPDRLNDLVASNALKELSDDPYSDGALIYEDRGDDFILYSVGGDFEDNGGVQVSEKSWGNGDDKVFWPIAW